MEKSGPLDVLKSLSFILVVSGLLWIVLYHWRRRKLYKLVSKVPGPSGYPIIGNALIFLFKDQVDLYDSIVKLYSNYSGLFKIWMGSEPFFCIYKPEHLEIVLNHRQCLAKSTHYDFTKPFMGNGLFSAPVNIWKKTRKLINPAFNQKLLDSFVPIFSEQAEIFLEVMKKNVGEEDLDIFAKISALQMDSVCETVMGIKMTTQTSPNDFGNKLDGAMAIAWMRAFNIPYHFEFIYAISKYGKEFNRLVSDLNKITKAVISEKMKNYEENMIARKNGEIIEETRKFKTFSELLVQLYHEDKQMSEQQIQDEVNTLLAAGTDTSTTTICFTLLTLGLHPELQEKVYEEIINVLGEDRVVTKQDLQHLDLLERFIKETMRLFPIAGFFMRKADDDIDLGDGVVPANATILINTMATHRNAKYWKDPLKFDPDRFLPEEVAKRHPYCYLPFSAGPRGCLGARYAIMSMKTNLATILRKYRITTDYKSIEEVSLKVHMLLRPADGFKLSLVERT
ncbi:hypothetical protein HHI36_021594 [Cryptolaemus montrouzieri]|uniref:Cytochrome P450 n=1 Tax=Cryptolaemus montrouzieri TaxID=559131 RepID=A0ABD2MXA2_9CUCU